MDKEHIIAEIRRTAKANGGVALGRLRFEAETDIRTSDWYPDFWLRWSEAVRDAGFESNRMCVAFDAEFLIEKLVLLTRRLGKVPLYGEIRREARADTAFPSHTTFRRLGPKDQWPSRVIAFCEANPGNDDVAALWRQAAITKAGNDTGDGGSTHPAIGYVYLLKHGSRRQYKIGATENPLRREGEIRFELPERLQPIHYIRTDDPFGVEAYWKNRFADKWLNGEWFALSADDIRAFKRWRRIY